MNIGDTCRGRFSAAQQVWARSRGRSIDLALRIDLAAWTSRRTEEADGLELGDTSIPPFGRKDGWTDTRAP